LRSLVSERVRMRESAYQQVAQGWGGKQIIGAPMLVIPVTLNNERGEAFTRDWYVLPESFDITADIAVQDERRSVGIYEVPVFVTKIHATSEFAATRQISRLLAADPSARVHLESARLAMFLNDPRGLRDVMITENDLVSGTLEGMLVAHAPALAAPLRADIDLQSGKQRFAFTMEIAGNRSLSILPLAHSTRAQIAGNWAHPGFTQGFLPVERHIAQKHFDARWQVLDLNNTYGSSWFEEETTFSKLNASAFGVDLVQPVDLYQRVERAVKYGGLFIGLSLLALFLWEQLAGKRLHPIQYGLMGLALSVFYLLLLALSEHVGFNPAYCIATVALCTLLGTYLAGAFASRWAGVGAGGMFAAVYALLYLLVTSEDYSLLAGALSLFGLLSAAMILTRKLDWYRSGEPTQA
jgi:inner membrane protein